MVLSPIRWTIYPTAICHIPTTESRIWPSTRPYLSNTIRQTTKHQAIFLWIQICAHQHLKIPKFLQVHQPSPSNVGFATGSSHSSVSLREFLSHNSIYIGLTDKTQKTFAQPWQTTTMWNVPVEEISRSSTVKGPAQALLGPSSIIRARTQHTKERDNLPRVQI